MNHATALLRVFCGSLVFIAMAARGQEVKVPAFTAYLDPHTNAARIISAGLTGWESNDKVIWGGILSPGELKAVLTVMLPKGETSKLKLTIAGHASEAEVRGTGEISNIDFGSFAIAASGYQRLELNCLEKSGKTFGDLTELILSGPAAKDAFFNLKPRRNAASVHLHYPLDKGVEAAAFYNELTPQTDPVATYYQACGFARGYFGMQVNSPTERRIIFSVWDSGKEAIDRSKVDDNNRVKLIKKGDGVVASDFGHEGTGGHSHLVYPWKVGDTQRFLVTSRIDGDATIYSGYFYFPEKSQWGLIASFRAPHDGGHLRGLYSFNENFDGANGYLLRKCEFGNQWIRTPEHKWIALTTAQFTHDGTGGADRRDFGAGVTKDGRFYLSNGGFEAESVTARQKFTREPSGKLPADFTISE